MATVLGFGDVGSSGPSAPDPAGRIPEPDVLLPELAVPRPGSEVSRQPAPWDPTEEDLLGVWLQVAGDDFRGLLVEFNDDGRFTMGAHGHLLGPQALRGSWGLDGPELRLHAPPDLACSDHLASHAPTRVEPPTTRST